MPDELTTQDTDHTLPSPSKERNAIATSRNTHRFFFFFFYDEENPHTMTMISTSAKCIGKPYCRVRGKSSHAPHQHG